MARVYAFETHNYTHHQQQAPVRVDYVFPRGEVRVVPDEVARIVCGAHPQKLRLLGEFEPPPGSEPVLTAIAEAPEGSEESLTPSLSATEVVSPEPKKPSRRRR